MQNHLRNVRSLQLDISSFMCYLNRVKNLLFSDIIFIHQTILYFNVYCLFIEVSKIRIMNDSLIPLNTIKSRMLLLETQNTKNVNRRLGFINPSLAEYDMPYLSKQYRSRSVGFWRPTDLDLHCLPLRKWIFIAILDQVIWLADN